MTRIEGKDLVLMLPPNTNKPQTIIITSGVRQLPDLLNVTATIEPMRALPDEETAEAA